MDQKIRRIVTGHDGQGKSVVVSDAATPMEGRLHELWLTSAMPAKFGGEPALGPLPKDLEPPKNGTVVRYVRFDPAQNITRAELEQRTAERFAAMKASHCRVDTSRHPGMHKTASVDYGIVLSGNITLLLDEGERDLQPFDVVIQRGTNHAWVNRGTAPALMAFILIDGVE